MAGNIHGGDLEQLARWAGRRPAEILDFSANINPLGPPRWLATVLVDHTSALVHYPDPETRALTAALAQRYAAAPTEILTGNGSTELLYLLARVAGFRRAVIPVPSYSDYARAAQFADMDVVPVFLSATDGFPIPTRQLTALLGEPALVFLGRPNNPTGVTSAAAEIRRLAAAHPQCLFLADEAFGDFVENFESLTTNRPANIAVLLSLTKIFAIPGLRLGAAVADAALARRVREHQPPWSVNTLAQAVGVAALADGDYCARTRALVSAARETLRAELQKMPGLVVYPGTANFLLVRLADEHLDAPTLAARLLTEDGIAIRVCANFQGLDNRFFRVAVRTHAENERLLAALARVLSR
jgi:L-threonine-O-3-phosphate decarboxylase